MRLRPQFLSGGCNSATPGVVTAPVEKSPLGAAADPN